MKDETSTDHIGLAVAFSQHVMRLQSLLDRGVVPVLEAQGLTRAELDVLGALRATDAKVGLRPKEIAARLLLTTGGLSNILRRLEASGLVERVSNPTDRRSYHVHLTAQGVVTANSATALAAEALRRTLADVEPAALARGLGVLQSIVELVDEAPPLTPIFRRSLTPET